MIRISRLLARRRYSLLFTVTMPGRFDYFRSQKLSAYRAFLMLASVMRAVCFYVYDPLAFRMTERIYHGQTFFMAAGFADMVGVPCLLACRCYSLDVSITMLGRFDYFRSQYLSTYRAFLMSASVMCAVCHHVHDPLAFRMP